MYYNYKLLISLWEVDNHENGASQVSSLLLLHEPDAFLINGRRMDGLTEGPDNNGWSTGHKCSYWEDLSASAHRRLSSYRWDDFSKHWRSSLRPNSYTPTTLRTILATESMKEYRNNGFRCKNKEKTRLRRTGLNCSSLSGTREVGENSF